jgi:hypothetical protein
MARGYDHSQPGALVLRSMCCYSGCVQNVAGGQGSGLAGRAECCVDVLSCNYIAAAVAYAPKIFTTGKLNIIDCLTVSSRIVLIGLLQMAAAGESTARKCGVTWVPPVECA